MRDIAPILREWTGSGHSFALATVVSVSGSAPRQPGAAMAVRADGTVAGSISGGCVEAAVHHAALDVLATGAPGRERFGYSTDDALAVGLTCGGEIEVFVQPVPPDDVEFRSLLDTVEQGEPVALATVLASDELAPGTRIAVYPGRPPHLGGARGLVATEASAMMEQDRTGLREVCTGPDGPGTSVFVQSWSTAPRMIVFGATDFARAVCDLGSYLGYQVTVCDARATFTTRARFPAAREVVVDWPHRFLARTPTDPRTVLCVLTHDAKFDVPLLTEALGRDVAYVGALGSRRTHTERLQRLREAGVTERQLARLRSPMGLDLGARTPEETALSIASEIVSARHGGSGSALSRMDGPIHGDARCSADGIGARA